MGNKSLGQIAFEAYKEDLEGKTYDGKQIPNWEDWVKSKAWMGSMFK